MKLSIFTPTHNPAYLPELYESLKAQTVTDFEWVIVTNNNPNLLMPADIAYDPRVKVREAPPEAGSRIGALKKFACSQCTGDVFVEVDHDDILAPVALERVRETVIAGAGFVFSDFANFFSDGNCQVYDRAYGWTSERKIIDKKLYTAMNAFECEPRSLCEIFYAPNHIRAWTREAYDLAGGHDALMDVCDDHDLLCRTYIAGVDMRRVPECLYLYRLLDGGGNSYVKHNALIQQKQQQVGNKYFYKLVDEWARRLGLPKWDLGGRLGCPEGYQSIDLHEADLICDVTTGLPFPDSSVGVIRAADFLEHIHPNFVVRVMNEIHRVLVPGGWLLSSTPSTDGRGAFQDPTHVSFWNENSFWYYTRQEQARYVPGIKCRFQGTRIWTEAPTEWHKANNIPYVYADLCALKGQKQAGIVDI